MQARDPRALSSPGVARGAWRSSGEEATADNRPRVRSSTSRRREERSRSVRLQVRASSSEEVDLPLRGLFSSG